MKIEVPVHGTIIVNGQKFICKEDNTNSCEKCGLFGLQCSDIECFPCSRSDKKMVYFEEFSGVLYDSRPVRVELDTVFPF